MSSGKSTECTTRKRNSKACDQCRKMKSRCERAMQADDPCGSCLLAGIDCTYFEPSHKRGPPKGYLSALEQRLRDAEALLGTILCSNDLRATTLLFDLSKDPLANSIIARVTESDFGPAGRAVLRCRDSTDKRQRQMKNSLISSIDFNGHLIFTAPSNTWQDYLNVRLALESRSRSHASSTARDALLEQPHESSSIPTCAPAQQPQYIGFHGSFPQVLKGNGLAGNSETRDDDAFASLSEHMDICQTTSHGMGSGDTSSPCSGSSRSSHGMGLGDSGKSIEDVDPVLYNDLANVLGLDSGPPTFLTPTNSASWAAPFNQEPSSFDLSDWENYTGLDV